jgi:poly(3-hydroxybutyrate) depolymerase
MLLLLACTSPDPTPATDADTTDTGTEADPLGGTAPLAELSDGECPDLSESGSSTFSSHGLDRKVRVILPSSGAEGAPVLFEWYWLGGSVRDAIDAFDLENWAEETGTVVVVPTSDPNDTFEWGFWNGGEDDLALYDDLRTCLSTDLKVDLTRFSSSGMSAGGLWTTFLANHRGDTLATELVFSGGTNSAFPYVTPASEFPALLVYGGDSDVFNGGVTVDFEAATLEYAEKLHQDGHFVVLCNHDRGHTIPPEGRSMLDAWIPAHRFGEASPFANGDLSALPDYCSVYDGG